MYVVVLVVRRLLPALAAGALAFPALAQVESITSTALREKQIQQYVESHALPSRVAEKIGRWETPICVKAKGGLKPELLEFVVRRVKAVAVRVGAPVNNDAACRENVEIGFASNPQSVMDFVRRNHISYLGFYNTAGEADRLARMTHPIQAWYATVTIDVRGESETDTPKGPPQCWDPQCRFQISGPVQHSNGTRVTNAVRTGFRNVLVLGDRDRLIQMEMGALADYIAFLVLAQPASLDDCSSLPSILNSLAANCPTNSSELSTADIAYLIGLYRMNSNRFLAGQKAEIAFQMGKALGTR